MKNKNGEVSIRTEFIGRFKREHWQYQSEWRYLLFLHLLKYMKKNARGEFQGSSVEDVLRKMTEGLRGMKLPTSYFDLPVDESLFSKMEILCGPLNTEEEVERIVQLAKRYNPSAIVKTSQISLRK